MKVMNPLIGMKSSILCAFGPISDTHFQDRLFALPPAKKMAVHGNLALGQQHYYALLY